VTAPLDRLGRPLGSLRISVTDRCNLRCAYCMPEAEYRWLPRDELLSDDEIVRLARVFVGLGARRLRLTGGEPLLRAGLERLVARLAAIDGVADLALTTNGVGLAERAAGLRAAGLGRVTVSLDTLKPERFRAIAGRPALASVLRGLEAARDAGFQGLKLNTVVFLGDN
jgi:cyclic pyranopterin phosphate synthase